MRALAHCALALILVSLFGAVPLRESRAEVSFTVGAPSSGVAARQALDLLTGGQHAALWERFTPEMQQALPVEKLTQLWTQVSAQVGAFRQAGEPEVKKTTVGDQIDFPCRFEQAALILQFVITGEGKIGGMHLLPSASPSWSAPAYVDSTRFHEEAIQVGGRLPGVLTLPYVDGGRVPAVVLIAGSGPQDRDESIGPNKALRDLAQGLGSRGIAVLRYDKRTLVEGASMNPLAVTVEEEVLADADSAIALLARRPEIDPSHLFVAGHSLGATLAPELAQRNPKIHGIVMMAASARPILKLIADQFRYLASIEPDSARAAALVERAKLADAHQNPALADTVMWMGMSMRYARDLDRRDPLGTAKKLEIPMLFVQGGRDYQVTMADFDLWQGALGNKEGVTFRLFQELNHLMIAGEGKASPHDYEKPGHVDARVIDELARFIRGN